MNSNGFCWGLLSLATSRKWTLKAFKCLWSHFWCHHIMYQKWAWKFPSSLGKAPVASTRGGVPKTNKSQSNFTSWKVHHGSCDPVNQELPQIISPVLPSLLLTSKSPQEYSCSVSYWFLLVAYTESWEPQLHVSKNTMQITFKPQGFRQYLMAYSLFVLTRKISWVRLPLPGPSSTSWIFLGLPAASHSLTNQMPINCKWKEI